VKIRPTAVATQPVTWVEKTPYKVRYVRISLDGSPAVNDDTARAAVISAFALLATPPTDIMKADLETWHTSQDINTDDGMETLLAHIDDQHDCSTFEWLPWGDDCPDADGAIWLGITPRSGSPAGTAQRLQLDNASRNTAIVPGDDYPSIAHELGHTLKLNHVNTQHVCSRFPKGAFDDLPDGGRIRAGDAFDPNVKQVVDGNEIYDFMSYECTRWVSRVNWRRVFDKF
jgi:hypothetical protein